MLPRPFWDDLLTLGELKSGGEGYFALERE
jgi:hypothetical protein